MRGAIVGVQPTRAVDLDSGSSSPPSAQHGHLDVTARVVGHPPKRGRITVTEQGAAATCQHRCHPASLASDGGVADGVHAVVKAMKAAGAETEFDLSAGEPELEELPGRHHPVLSRGEGGQPALDRFRCGLSTHTVVNPHRG
jgi:hypothetical protein